MIINLENAIAIATTGVRSRDELIVAAAYLASEVKQLQAENAKLRKQRDKCAQWAGVDLSELEEMYP